ncbi:FAD-dependent oxidoreductase [Aurantimonas endophytica]|uniref:D-amino-acid dehydrogenase n=1 Tax=Aurantimonas endophytica TaxID=1522175 RepID=A0A7W6HDQ0_9HYPH|nr:D-amino-acid dehydrogenase [Aurantimonas endophytica]MCO6403960.1 FAD-dependent oxidoreductase [Aurantimonas endophytica]
MTTGDGVAIVGAGIVGTALAFRLAERGEAVTLFDAGAPGTLGPSRGNAGHIAASDIFPLSHPGIALEALGMLANPNGPLKIDPRYLPTLAPWLATFLRTGSGERFEAATRAISLLCDGTVAATERLFADAGIANCLRRVPALYVYDSAGSLDAAGAGWRRKAAAGHPSTLVDQDQLRELEPALSHAFAGGVLSHHWGQVSDPKAVVDGLYDAARGHGAAFRQARVEAIVPSETGVTVREEGRDQRFARVVVAAGVRSGDFAARLGEKLPVTAEGGYNVTYPSPFIAVNHPLVFADHGMVSTSLRPGLRIGGWAEYAGPDASFRPAYHDRIARIAKRFFPRLDQRDQIRWAGRRPSMPDSTPVISRSTVDPRLFYATGHGHYGLTWSARTAEIMTALMDGDEAAAAPFSIRRFNR